MIANIHRYKLVYHDMYRMLLNVLLFECTALYGTWSPCTSCTASPPGVNTNRTCEGVDSFPVNCPIDKRTWQS